MSRAFDFTLRSEHLISIDFVSERAHAYSLPHFSFGFPAFSRVCHRTRCVVYPNDLPFHVLHEIYDPSDFGGISVLDFTPWTDLGFRRITLHFSRSGNAIGILTYLYGVGRTLLYCLVCFYDATAHILQNFLSRCPRRCPKTVSYHKHHLHVPGYHPSSISFGTKWACFAFQL